MDEIIKLIEFITAMLSIYFSFFKHCSWYIETKLEQALDEQERYHKTNWALKNDNVGPNILPKYLDIVEASPEADQYSDV